MATRSTILAWRIPWTEEPGGLQSMESHRVRHSCVADTRLAVSTRVCVYFFLFLRSTYIGMYIYT